MRENATPFTFTLEVLPENVSDTDPALISALGRDVAGIFREQGETVEPVYTGKRGGEFLAQVTTLLTTAWANKELILSDTGALVTILTPLVQTARYLWHAYEQRVGQNVAQQHPLTITIEVNGIRMKVEAMNWKDAVAMATDLAHHLQAQHSAVNAPTPSSTTARIQVSVPKRATRKRR